MTWKGQRAWSHPPTKPPCRSCETIAPKLVTAVENSVTLARILLKRVMGEVGAMALNSEQIRKLDEDIATFDRALRAKPGPTDEESAEFCHIMLVLVNAAKVNYCKLREALDADDQIEMAWACRNLLEIAIFSNMS